MVFWRSKEPEKVDETKDIPAPSRGVEVTEEHAEDAEMLEFDALHKEASTVDYAYQRKVFIFHKVLNEHIGMTAWQWGLLCVCGVGWLLDNVWLQYVAMILPQIELEFDLEHSSHSAFMTLSLFAGLTVGAAVWGVLADIVGRRFSFNMTLFIAGVFGVAAGGATNFVALGGLVGALGFGLGGSLPVDGMLFLEFIPGTHQFLLAFMSVFWPLGQLLVSLVGWGLIYNYSASCKAPHCAEQVGLNGQHWLNGNHGWRYLGFAMGGLTLLCFVVRFFVFRMPESPKFLLSKGRDAEAVVALHRFARMCGRELSDDVVSVAILRSAAGEDGRMDEQDEHVEEPKGMIASMKHSLRSMAHNARSIKFGNSLSHIRPLFSSFSMGYTVTMIWLLWGFIGLGYPLFTAFLPLLLSQSSPNETYRNYAITSVCGVPGSILSAALVEVPHSGRRGALAIGTLLTGIFLFTISGLGDDHHTAVFALECVTTFTQNIVYGVLYCYTPEAFPAPYRGTGDGVSSSLNRLFGLMAPIISIYSGNQGKIPFYVAGALYIASAFLAVTVRVETSKRTAM